MGAAGEAEDGDGDGFMAPWNIKGKARESLESPLNVAQNVNAASSLTKRFLTQFCSYFNRRIRLNGSIECAEARLAIGLPDHGLTAAQLEAVIIIMY